MSKDWKSNLISSSLPLEYEAAKILVQNGYSIDADYTYRRRHLGINKDFSVDIYALGFPPFKDPNVILGTIELLIECKQRHPNTIWLFLPEVNEGDFSPETLGITIRAIDDFSTVFFQSNVTVEFDGNVEFCYKGVEIETSTGNVHDSEIRHGIEQLRYALPRLLINSIFNTVTCHPDDNHPFLFSSILLTTAPLFIANDDFQIQNIQNISKLEEISQQVPYLVLYSNYGPDFEDHCKEDFSKLSCLFNDERLEQIEIQRRKCGVPKLFLPKSICRSLVNGNPSIFHGYFNQFIVCSMDYFPMLLRDVNKIAMDAVENLSEDYPEREVYESLKEFENSFLKK